jgi:hypothetical protein
MYSILILALSLAHAQDEPKTEVQSVPTNTMDSYEFRIESCDTIRAIARDEREETEERSKRVVVSIENAGTEMCLYNSVGMKGWINGSYVVSRRNTQDQGFHILPNSTVSLRVTPRDVDAKRGALRLEIPPDRGQVVLIGMTPEES